MNRIEQIEGLRSILSKESRQGASIGFVPTMGALHEGHLSLIHQARANHDVVVVSIFVNPLQFGEGEDYETYPRTITNDMKLCEQAGVDVLFTPTVSEMYPEEASLEIKVVQGVDVLCGKSRPGHFDGVATVVLKLLHMVWPDAAYFGQKDAQQVAVIQQMVKTLSMPINIVAGPTVREEDGLAKSSRNVRLTQEERKLAPTIYATLLEAKALVETGADREQLLMFMQQKLNAIELGHIDYVQALSYPTLDVVDLNKGSIILAVAYHFSNARLIDNILIER